MKIDVDNFFLVGIFLIIALCIFRYIYSKKTVKSNKTVRETLDYNEMEIMFLNNISENNRPYKLLNIYFPFDLMIIKSLFMSEQLPYYVEFEHMMGLRPFIPIINYNNANFYILEEDYNDAIIVIETYLRNKTLNNYKIKERLRNLFELALINWVTYSPQNNLGVEVIYKNMARTNGT